MEKNQDMNVLDEVNKGATMGMDAIDYLVPKVRRQIIYMKIIQQKKNHMKQMQ